ncbi:methylmalonyl-CoA mutase family protein [uncultured Lutibacter sp.]|uniref:methylmalonyl-CoA mutase family protein n=1 Tax=uncultured Lutibacter sp. TaxID=437739 RepID=UPI0026306A18|nr:methylmalonyl-CoA mutase family protein [uncultured Lutibacter sp.]
MKRKDFSKLAISTQYTKEVNFNHENYVAGIAPFLRGIHSTMHVKKPWTIIQSTRFSTAEEGNAFYRKNLTANQKHISVVFDLATNLGYDSDHEHVQNYIGKNGIAIDSVEDMKILFKKLPLEQLIVSISINKAVLPILAFYIVAAKEQNIDENLLSGILQIDELTLHNTTMQLPKPPMRIISDILDYTNKHLPKFNTISISNYHLQKVGILPEIELAYTLANGLKYLKAAINSGVNIDSFATKLSFSWNIDRNHFIEIAKMRAARMLWAKIVKQFNPKNQESLALKVHCQTHNWSSTKQHPFDTITETTIKALTAAFGGAQSIDTNIIDNSNELSEDFSDRIALNTQLFIQEETNITNTVDPWAGSSFVEKQTQEITTKTWALLQEIEKFGGINKAIENGILNIQVKSNINLSIQEDNKLIRRNQLNNLTQLKASRNTSEISEALNNLAACSKTGNGNLLELAIIAAKKRATLGEISNALENIFE